MASFQDSDYPVVVPIVKALDLPLDQFEKYITTVITRSRKKTNVEGPPKEIDIAVTAALQDASLGDAEERDAPTSFMDAVAAFDPSAPPTDFNDDRNKVFTQNGDVAFASSNHAIVDLFYELEDTVSPERLDSLLHEAWRTDSEATLKIIFNGRSIHLGKASRTNLYRCAGWLRRHHPLSLLLNLKWLVRPIIPKKGKKETDKTNEDDFELLSTPAETEIGDTGLADHDVKNGLAHGYWKDLLNILVLEVTGNLDVTCDANEVLNIKPKAPRARTFDKDQAKKERHDTRDLRYTKAMDKLRKPFFCALYLTVARLFVRQLSLDSKLLSSGDKLKQRQISLAAKWAPSTKGFHDRYTCITSTIAAALHGASAEVSTAGSPDYFRKVRIEFQKSTLSPLRSFLQVVERAITAKTYSEIKYETVPSIAMQNYTKLFYENDQKRFKAYLKQVASGQKHISGAVLLPSTLVQKAMTLRISSLGNGSKKKRNLDEAMYEVKCDLINAQWNTLVQRVKDAGSLDDAIAVCDVSGSMTADTLSDGTTPMHTALGMSLLVAEVTAQPFGGQIITFSEKPRFIRVGGPDDARPFKDKIRAMYHDDWGANTNFTAVFLDLLLPAARAWDKKNNKKGTMVKRIFVFSDMQFDEAQHRTEQWSTSYERIKDAYARAHYEMPELVFWNLSGGGQPGDVATKPVTGEEKGTALVSGYSQGLLRMYMDKSFAEEEEEEDVVMKDAGDDAVRVEVEKKKSDPLRTVMRALSHDAYKMLKVYD